MVVFAVNVIKKWTMELRLFGIRMVFFAVIALKNVPQISIYTVIRLVPYLVEGPKCPAKLKFGGVVFTVNAL